MPLDAFAVQSLRPGDKVWIVGSRLSGKTTLLQSLARALQIETVIDDHDSGRAGLEVVYGRESVLGCSQVLPPPNVRENCHVVMFMGRVDTSCLTDADLTRELEGLEPWTALVWDRRELGGPRLSTCAASPRA
jgi:nicotinamide riboside kinase